MESLGTAAKRYPSEYRTATEGPASAPLPVLRAPMLGFVQSMPLPTDRQLSRHARKVMLGQKAECNIWTAG